MKKERKWKNWAFFTKCRCWWTFWHIGRSGAVWVGCVCFGQAFAFVTTTGQAGWAVTPEALAAHSHLSTPISAACVPLSGLHKQDGAWREDDKKRKRERESGGTARLWWDGTENSKSKELYCVIGDRMELRVNLQWQVCPPSPMRGMTVH